MKDVKIAHLGLTILLRHFMMQLLYPLLTSLDLKTTSWSLFLMLSCALPQGPQLLNELEFASFHRSRVINWSQVYLKPITGRQGLFWSKIRTWKS